MCVYVLLHYHMLQIQKGLTSPSVQTRDRFCTIISDFKVNSSSRSSTVEFPVLRKNLPVNVNTASVSQSMVVISYWFVFPVIPSNTVLKYTHGAYSVQFVYQYYKERLQRASEKEPNVKGWCRIPYTVHQTQTSSWSLGATLVPFGMQRQRCHVSERSQ